MLLLLFYTICKSMFNFHLQMPDVTPWNSVSTDAPAPVAAVVNPIGEFVSLVFHAPAIICIAARIYTCV
jgi:hypothetical protein